MKTGKGHKGNFLFTNGRVIEEYNAEGTDISSLEISDNPVLPDIKPVNCIMADRSGIIWLGTNSGLFKIDPRRYQFRKYSTHNLSRQLQNNYIRAIHTYDDQLWLGYKQGEIQRLTIDTVTGMVLSRKNYMVEMKPGDYMFSYPTINIIRTTRGGKVWAGGTEGLFLLDEQKGHFALYKPSNASIPLFFRDMGLV